MNYREENETSKAFKQAYSDGIDRVIRSRRQELSENRRRSGSEIFKDPEAHREKFRKMLGWPLVDRVDTELPPVKSQLLAKEEGYSIYRMQIRILDELEMTGLYFEADTAEPRPLVLVQHGGAGTPELISGFYGGTDNYNCMLERVISFGVHAFAPQLLLWHDRFGVPYNRQAVDLSLKHLGGSVAALEIYGISRALDYFEKQDNVTTFGMVGLSYGGFYTLMTAAVDRRIRSSISCAYFNTRDQYPWSDWIWFNSAAGFDDAEIACLVYPRKLCIEIADKDELFDIKYGVESYERVCEYCKDVGTDWLSFIPFDGTHEFPWDDEPIKKMIEDLLR